MTGQLSHTRPSDPTSTIEAYLKGNGCVLHAVDGVLGDVGVVQQGESPRHVRTRIGTNGAPLGLNISVCAGINSKCAILLRKQEQPIVGMLHR